MRRLGVRVLAAVKAQAKTGHMYTKTQFHTHVRQSESLAFRWKIPPLHDLRQIASRSRLRTSDGKAASSRIAGRKPNATRL